MTQCAHLFRKFELELGSDMYDREENPKNRLVEMLHSGSPESVKTHVLHQFSDNNTSSHSCGYYSLWNGR